MKKTTSIIIWVIIIAAAAGFIIYELMQAGAPAAHPVYTSPISASYSCDAGKIIGATYLSGDPTPAPAPGEPPVPTGSVELALSDGRNLTLAQTISADGARYANADESIIFWNKGNGLTFTENAVQTFSGCIEVKKDPGNMPLVYESGAMGFSLRYPTGFTPDSSYLYQALGPGKDISGVKFTIPPSLASGTNLSSDSYVSVEEIPKASSCNANLFLSGTSAQSINDSGTEYSFASSTDAGAGNRYEELVYAMPYTNPCIAIRYFIHYAVFENFPAGAVKEFDNAEIKSQMDAIRQTLTIAQ